MDRFISTDSGITDMQNLISYQVHKHSNTCLREIRGKQICRFKMPHPPMPSTIILLPFPDDTDET